jgi:hypothetical protein
MDCTTLLLLYFTSLSTTDIQTTVELLLGWSPQLTLEISTPRYLSRFSGLPVILYFAYAIWMEPYWITWILIMSCSWMLLFHQTVWITFYQLSSFCIKLQSSMMKAIGLSVLVWTQTMLIYSQPIDRKFFLFFEPKVSPFPLTNGNTDVRASS